MTPYEVYAADQDRFDQQEAIAVERRIEGTTDAAFGYRAQYADDAYLLGYVEGLRQLNTDCNGRILHDGDS